MKRGEIHLADLGEPLGHESGLRRPVLLLAADAWLISHPPVIPVIPITRSRRDWPTHVEIEPGVSGLSATSYATCEHLRSISPLRLLKRYGSLDAVTMMRVDIIVRRLLGI